MTPTVRFRPQLLVLAAVLIAPAAQAGALLKLLDQAQSSDQTYVAARYQRDAAIEAKPLARAALLPQIGASASYFRQQANAERSASSVGSPTGGVFTIESTTTERDYGVNLNQAVFDWAAVQKYWQADDQVALAETGYQSARQQLILRLAQAYFALLNAQDSLRYADALREAVGRQLEQSKQRFEVGLSAITDVQEAQARSDLALSQQIAAQAAVANASRSLGEIVGRSADTAPLREEIPLLSPEPASSETWVSAARADNLGVIAARLQQAVASRGVDVARAGHYPTVGFTAGYTNTDGDYLDRKTDIKSPQSSDGNLLQLTAKLPLFAGGAVAASVRSAKASAQQSDAAYQGAMNTAATQAGNAYQNVIAGIALVRANKQAVVSSQTALEASELGLQVGARTAIDVLNARQQLFSAQRDYAQARYNYLLAVLNLKAASGRLSEKDLAEIDRLLVAG